MSQTKHRPDTGLILTLYGYAYVCINCVCIISLNTVRLRTIKLSQLIHLEGEGVSDSIVGQWPHFGIAIYSIRVRYCHKVRVSHSLCKHLDIYIYIMHPSGINNVKLKDLLHIIKKTKMQYNQERLFTNKTIYIYKMYNFF